MDLPLSSVSASGSVAGDGVIIAPSPVESVLAVIDYILAALAVVVFLLWLGAVLSRGWRNPLAGAPARPNRLAEDAVALAVLSYLCAVLALSGLAKLLGADSLRAVAAAFVGGGAHVAGIVACLTIASTRFAGGARQFVLGPPIRRGRADLARTGVITLVALGVCPFVGHFALWIARTVVPEYSPEPHPTLKMLNEPEQTAAAIAVLWVGAGLIAPVAEEFFFRGFLQTLFFRWFRGRWPAILVASILFGAIHYQQLFAIPALTLLGVFMGYLYERTGSLVCPVAVHSAFNLKTLLWDALGATAP